MWELAARGSGGFCNELERLLKAAAIRTPARSACAWMALKPVEWIAQLDAPDPTEAIRALGEHGAAAREAVEPLRAMMLNDPSRQTRLTALSRVGVLPAKTVDALRPLQQHDYVWVRKCASEALQSE